jgi:hypothetical protein
MEENTAGAEIPKEDNHQGYEFSHQVINRQAAG